MPSHSLPVVAQVATCIAAMRSGRLVEVGPADQALNHPREEYIKQLLAAVPAI